MNDMQPGNDNMVEQTATPPHADTDAALTLWGFPRLKTCPQCEYSLTGLPAPHRCPECGLEYDEFSCEWVRPTPTRRQKLKAVGWTIVLFGLFGIAHGLIFHGQLLLLLLAGLGLEVAVVIVLVVFSHGGGRRRRGFVALVPGGIYVRYLGCNEIIRWNSEIRVREPYGRLIRGLQLDRRKLGVWTGIPLGHIIKGHENRVAFAQAIEEGRRRHANSVSQPAAQPSSH